MKRLALINSLGGTFHLVKYHNDNFYLLGDDTPSLKEMVNTNNYLWDFIPFIEELEKMTDDRFFEVYCIDDDFLSYIINAIDESEDESVIYYISNHFFKDYNNDYYITHKCNDRLHEMGLL